MIRFDQEQTDTVRIALNASFLQRLIGTGYYYYDDISVPLIAKEEGWSSAAATYDQKRPLLLLSEQQESSSSSDDQLGRLWIQLCSGLAQKEREYQQKHQKYLAIFLMLWLVAMTLLMIFISDVYELPPVLLLLVPALLAVSTKWVFICLPEKHGIYCTKMALSSASSSLLEEETGNTIGLEQELYFQEIQSIVDDLAPSFAEIGYTLDYVEDFRSNCPFLAYIRMTAATTTTTTTTTKDENNNSSSGVMGKGGGDSNKNGRAASSDDSDDGYVLVMDETTSSVSSSTASPSSSSLSLSERLKKFQWEAWEEHSGQVADRIQQHYAKSRSIATSGGSTTTRLMGIPIQKLASYRNVILYACIPILVFFWFCMNFGIAESFLYFSSSSHSIERVS